MFERLPLVITSSTRSGTTYMAKLLTVAGLPCTHETAFHFTKYWSQIGFMSDPQEADSSWLSLPFLHALPAHVPIIWLMRDAEATINSIARQLTHNETYIQSGQFAYEYLKLYYKAPKALSAYETAASFWVGWHELIWRDLKYRRNTGALKTEGVTAPILLKIGDKVGKQLDSMRCGQAVRVVSRSTNTRGEVQILSLDDMKLSHLVRRRIEDIIRIHSAAPQVYEWGGVQ